MQQVASTGDLYVNGEWVSKVTDFKFTASEKYNIGRIITDKDVEKAYGHYYRCIRPYAKHVKCRPFANSKHKSRQVRMRGK